MVVILMEILMKDKYELCLWNSKVSIIFREESRNMKVYIMVILFLIIRKIVYMIF